jgi:hypothetical protein
MHFILHIEYNPTPRLIGERRVAKTPFLYESYGKIKYILWKNSKFLVLNFSVLLGMEVLVWTRARGGSLQ